MAWGGAPFSVLSTAVCAVRFSGFVETEPNEPKHQPLFISPSQSRDFSLPAGPIAVATAPAAAAAAAAAAAPAPSVTSAAPMRFAPRPNTASDSSTDSRGGKQQAPAPAQTAPVKGKPARQKETVTAKVEFR